MPEAWPRLAWHGGVEDGPIPVHRLYYIVVVSTN